jgi:hypothetical protein
MGQVAAWMRAPGREVDRTAFEQDGVPVRLARIAGGNGIDRIVMRAAVGRFVIDYSGPFLTDASGLSDEEAKLRGLRRFGSPKAQVVKVLSAFPLANLKSR